MKYLFTLLIIYDIALIATVSYKHFAKDSLPIVNPGELWYGGQSENPFEKTTIDTLRILNVKEGWVQYIRHGDTLSDRIWWFEKGLFIKIK